MLGWKLSRDGTRRVHVCASAKSTFSSSFHVGARVPGKSIIQLQSDSIPLQSSLLPTTAELADAFYLTNRLRSQHGVPSLTWNKEYAEDVAKIAGACGGKPQVRDDVEDNIAWGYATFGAAVQAWYDEVSTRLLQQHAGPAW